MVEPYSRHLLYEVRSREMNDDERTDGLVSPAQTDICDHRWFHKAGADYRATPVAICVKCYAELLYVD